MAPCSFCRQHCPKSVTALLLRIYSSLLCIRVKNRVHPTVCSLLAPYQYSSLFPFPSIKMKAHRERGKESRVDFLWGAQIMKCSPSKDILCKPQQAGKQHTKNGGKKATRVLLKSFFIFCRVRSWKGCFLIKAKLCTGMKNSAGDLSHFQTTWNIKHFTQE